MIIKTSNGHDVLIDDVDAGIFNRWAWVAVKKHGTYYACRNEYTLGGKVHRKSHRIYLHRAILDDPDGQVDHLNGNGLDNRRCNLRVASHSENQRNRSGAQRNSKSGIRGVYWHKQREKWAASIRVNGRKINLGLHDNIESAAAARLKAEMVHWAPVDRYRAMIAAAEVESCR